MLISAEERRSGWSATSVQSRPPVVVAWRQKRPTSVVKPRAQTVDSQENRKVGPDRVRVHGRERGCRAGLGHVDVDVELRPVEPRAHRGCRAPV